MSVDISEELYTIKNDTKGYKVKNAIYTAIDKLNRSPIPTPAPPPADEDLYPEVSVVYTNELVDDNMLPEHSFVFDTIGFNGLFYQTATSSATSKTTVNPVGNCLLLAVIFSISQNAAPDGDDWTRVYKSENLTAKDSSANRWGYSIWSKMIDGGSHGIRINKTNGTISYFLCCLYGASSITVVDDEILNSASITPTSVTTKPRLYFVSDMYFHTEDYESTDGINLYDITFSISGYGHMWYDYHHEKGLTPNIVLNSGKTFYQNRFQILTIDINY